MLIGHEHDFPASDGPQDVAGFSDEAPPSENRASNGPTNILKYAWNQAVKLSLLCPDFVGGGGAKDHKKNPN